MRKLNIAVTLLTRDGSKTGNAILYGLDKSYYTDEDLFLIETDFGNRLRLTNSELDEYFKIGRPVCYKTWQEDRLKKIQGNSSDGY